MKRRTEAGSNAIKELYKDNNGPWSRGALQIENALGGTNLAAVAYHFQNQAQIRIYYQDKHLNLKEYCFNNSGWFQDQYYIVRCKTIRLKAVDTDRRRVQPWPSNRRNTPRYSRVWQCRASSLLA